MILRNNAKQRDGVYDMSTIRDVARLAEVSTATVSRVLNNDLKYKITDETRQRVLATAKELGYVLPQPSGKSSSAAASNMKIGCILRLTKKKFNDPYYMSIVSAAEDRLREQGYEIAFLRTTSEIEDRSHLQALFQDPVKGIILMDELDEDAYRFIKDQGVSIVGIDTNRTDIDNIGYDRHGAALMATKYLIEQGHTKIGFIGGSGRSKDIKNSQRFRGYQTAMYCNGLSVNEDWVIDCEWDEDICAQKIDELCHTGNYPTAFFISSDLMAMAALNRFYNNNIRVPHDMSIISVTDIEIAKYANPPLTTFRIPTDEIGYVAADMLIKRINGYNLLPQKVILPCSLIVRGTTK